MDVVILSEQNTGHGHRCYGVNPNASPLRRVDQDRSHLGFRTQSGELGQTGVDPHGRRRENERSLPAAGRETGRISSARSSAAGHDNRRFTSSLGPA